MKRLSLAALAIAVTLVACASAQDHPAPVSAEVMTIEAAPSYATVPANYTVDTTTHAPVSAPLDALEILGPLSLLAFAGAVKTVVADKDGYPALATSDRGNLNQLIRDFYHWSQNRIIAATAATYPVVAIGTDTTKVKTTNATVLLNNGVVNALAATDNFWTLTGDDLATGKSRKYLLCVDAADAASVIASDDQASADDCRFSIRPADGVAVVGLLQIDNASGAAFVPGTTGLDAAGITDTYLDGSTDLAFLSKVVLPN